MKTKTLYIATWYDQYDNTYGTYAGFESRGKCLDYLVDTVMERAEILGVDVLDNKAFPQKIKIGPKQVRDHLGSYGEFILVLSFNELDEPEEYVSMGICETDIKE